MASSLSRKLEMAAGLLAALGLILLLSTGAKAQVPSLTPLPAPPPMRLVPREDRAQLEAARDAKARARLSVELAEARLARAEQLTSAQQFETAGRELGIYLGILEDAMRYLKGQKEQKKLRDTYKRFEITLRSHAMRLETMRRSTPSEYAVNIKSITDDTRDVRAEALNGFYGDAVISNTPAETEEKTPDERKANAPSQSSTKEEP